MYDKKNHYTILQAHEIVLNGCESAINIAKFDKKIARIYLDNLTDLTNDKLLLDEISKCYEKINEI